MAIILEDLKGEVLLNVMSRIEKSISHVSESGCIIWGKKPNVQGYAQMTIKTDREKTVGKVHRITWMLANGRNTKPKTHLDHKCRVKMCINPQHIQETSSRLNLENVSNVNRKNSTGFRNVYVHSKGGFYVRIQTNSKSIYGGYFKDIEDAKEKAFQLRMKHFSNNLEDRK